MKINIENKLAIITGGARGIGAALAQEFLKNKIKIIITSRNHPFDDQKILSDAITMQQLDVTNIHSVMRFFDWINFLETPIHFLVNNAGTGIFKPLCDIEFSDWKSVIE